MAWLERAAKIRGRDAILVALAIWFVDGRQGGDRPIRVTNQLVARFGVARKSKYAALKALERAGLVRLITSRGKTTTVLLVEVWNHPDPQDGKAAEKSAITNSDDRSQATVGPAT
jgi:DNA-binding FadR family transcriptional regulator